MQIYLPIDVCTQLAAKRDLSIPNLCEIYLLVQKPEGGALQSIVERFVSDSVKYARESNSNPESITSFKLNELFRNGFRDTISRVFVASLYGKVMKQEMKQLKSDSIRWLRAEFTTKTDARTPLGVRPS